MADITSQNVAQAIVKLVASQALPALYTKLVMARLVNRDYEPSLASAGDTINVPIPPDLVANNIAEGGSVQTQNPSLGNAQIVLNTHVESTFQIPDVTKILATPDLVKVYMDPALIAVATKIETDLLNLYPLFTANAAVGGASAMDEARIDAAESALFLARVPQDQQKFLVVYANAFSAMRQIERFTEQRMVATTGGILDAELPGAGPLMSDGKIKDFLVFRSQNVPAVSSTYQQLAFSKDAIGMAIRRLPQPLPGTGAIAEYASFGGFEVRVVMSYQPNTLAQQFTVDTLYGCGPLRNSAAVNVQST